MNLNLNKLSQAYQLNAKPGQVPSLQKEWMELDGENELSQFLTKIGVSQEFVHFLAENGGERKLREAFVDYFLFDIKYGTKTSQFLSEQFLQTLAEQYPELFAKPEEAKSTVRHRPSRTNTIVEGLKQAVNILEHSYGIEAGDARLVDLGCGAGKVIAVAMGRVRVDAKADLVTFPFKKAVGVDLFQHCVEMAVENIKNAKNLGIKLSSDEGETDFSDQNNTVSLHTEDERTISFAFGSAVDFKEYNGINVVYMYNPFDGAIMDQVERRLRKNAGKVLVVYNKPEQLQYFSPAKGWKEEYRQESDDPDKQLVVLSFGFSNGMRNFQPVNDLSTAPKVA